MLSDARNLSCQALHSCKTGKYWTRSWNPISGCTPISPGCANCWAKAMHERFHGKGSFGKVTLHPDRLEQPLHWRKPQIVFTDMCDPFHLDVPDDFLDRMMAVIALCPQHRFLLLTKRAYQMRGYMAGLEGSDMMRLGSALASMDVGRLFDLLNYRWPLPNLWLGVTAENQEQADKRISYLLATPAAHRWLSVEPLLMHVDLPAAYLNYGPQHGDRSIDWVVVGGESGHGSRLCNVTWIRSVVEQCQTAGVPCWVKQLGSAAYIDRRKCPDCNGSGIEQIPCGPGDADCEFCGGSGLFRGEWPGRLLASYGSGRNIDHWSEDLQVRQMPAELVGVLG